MSSKLSDDEIYQKLAMFKKEITEIVRECGLSAVGLPASEAAALHRHMNEVLIDKIKEQDRHILWALGEKIEPKHHFGEAIITGEGANFG